MKTSTAGLAALVADEGEVLTAYRDVVGVWTIGVGLTAASGLITPKEGMTITRAESRRLLALALDQKYEPSVRAMLPDAFQHEFDGAVSFHYNTGAIKSASWVSAFKSGARELARSKLLLWNKAGGKVIRGLTLRREREANLIFNGVYPHGIQPEVALPNVPAPVVVEEPVKVLKSGSTGEQVVFLQQRLQALGLYKGSTDGKFGPKTDLAVRAFQRLHKVLTVDGVAGPATLATLQRVSDATSKTVRYAAISGGTSAIGIGTMPAWGSALVVAAGIAAVGFIVWRYRDEFRALMKMKTDA